MMMARTQTQKEAPPLAWVEDARRRGEAIIKESERQGRELDHAEETVVSKENMTDMLDK